MAPIALPAEFGYIGLVVAATFFMNFWHMMRIGSLRKKYGIKYPAMTSDKHEDFMYAQRVHQNNLEQLPFFYVNLLLAAAFNPTAAGIMGAVWVVGRIVYSLGYYSSPEKRVPGAAAATLTLAAMAVFNLYSSLKLLKVF